MSLDTIRSQIDRLDGEILRLLHQRMELALRAGRQKPAIFDPQREAEVIEHVVAASTSLIDEPFVRALYDGILGHSKQIQSQHPTLVGFQGEAGAWGDIAARKLNASFIPLPFLEFADVFEAVRERHIDYGLVPIENSLEGAVTEVNDLLIDTELNIINEVVVPIRQNLLSLPHNDYKDIKVVYSHPQALAQCRGFLARNKLEPRPFYDTAGAARWLSRDRPNGVAVIASSHAAHIYGLEIINENIEDRPGNSTRFVLLSREPSQGPSGKCTVVFSTPHRAGSLFDTLELFAREGINLTRIESRPSRREAGTYVFLLDFLAVRDDDRVARVFEAIKHKTVSFKVLGFYPEGRL